MELYQEQTVVRSASMRDRLLYMLAWVFLCVVALLTLVFAASIAQFNDVGKLRVNWFSVIGFLLFGACAVWLWRSKDKLHMEYDYSIRGDVLEICAVLNGRRRQNRVRMEVSEITACGVAGSAAHQRAAGKPGLKTHRWYLNRDAKLYYLCYNQGQEHHMMLLELNPEMAAQLRRELRQGVWQE